MRRHRQTSILFAGLIACVAAGQALASQQPQSNLEQRFDLPDWISPTHTNAALLYSRYWIQGSELFFDESLSEVKHGGHGPDYDLPRKLREAMERHADVLDGLEKAAWIEPCDWGVEYEQGFLATMPHLGMLRHTARLMRTDAWLLYERGDPDRAARRLGSLYGMASHLEDDRMLISSLVSAAIAALANDVVNAMIDEGGLTPDAARTLLDAMERIHDQDPFGAQRAFMGERDLATRWILQAIEHPSEQAALDGEIRRTIRYASHMPRETLLREIERMREYYDDAMKHWDAPDDDHGLEALEREVAAGGYGMLARVLAPAMGKASHSVRTASEQTRQTASRLRDLAE